VRNHQAIVQPRLYDCLMVTHITLGGRGFGVNFGRRSCLTRALAEDDNSEECAILSRMLPRPRPRFVTVQNRGRSPVPVPDSSGTGTLPRPRFKLPSGGPRPVPRTPRRGSTRDSDSTIAKAAR
jgi:hypothetical protein